MKMLIAAVFFASVLTTQAIAYSQAELTEARAAANIFVEQLRKSGISGVNNYVAACYKKASVRHKNLLIPICVTMDSISQHFDLAVIEQLGIARSGESENSLPNTMKRVDAACRTLKYSYDKCKEEYAKWTALGMFVLPDVMK